MKRRRYLRVVGGGITVALAGCGSSGYSAPENTTTSISESEPENTSGTTSETGSLGWREVVETTPNRTPEPNPTTKPGNLALGDTFQTPDGIVLSILELTTATFDNSDKQAGLAYAYAANETESAEFIPFHIDWVMLADNRQYETESIHSRDWAYEGGEVFAGVVREGWILYEIPQELDENDLSIGWSKEYYDVDTGETQVRVTWSATTETTTTETTTTPQETSNSSGQEADLKESGRVSYNSEVVFVGVNQGETIRIKVTEEEKSPAGGTLFRLYNPDGEQLLEKNVDDETTVTHQAEQGGDFRVEFYTGGTASYKIYVEPA